MRCGWAVGYMEEEMEMERWSEYSWTEDRTMQEKKDEIKKRERFSSSKVGQEETRTRRIGVKSSELTGVNLNIFRSKRR